MNQPRLTGGAVLQLRKLTRDPSHGPSAGPDPYRCMLSDGIHTIQCVLDYGFQASNKNLVIVKECEVLGTPSAPYGSPSPYPGSLGPTATSLPDSVATTVGVIPQHIGLATQQNTFQSAPAGSSGSPVFPISALNQYVSRWQIKARVTTKIVRDYNSAKGPGKLCSVDLVDKEGTEIRATMFNDEVDRLGPLLEKDKVYYISNGNIKQANKKYSSLTNDYEITFSNTTQVVPDTTGDSGDIRQIYKFKPIADILYANKDDHVDVIGVLINISDVSSINSKKDNTPLSKRTVTLLDETSRSVELTLWGHQAEGFSAPLESVLAVKGARVSDFGGKTLGTSMSTSLQLNPAHQRASELRVWFDSHGGLKNIAIHPLSTSGQTLQRSSITGTAGPDSEMSRGLISFEDAAEGKLGTVKADVYDVVATIQNVKSDGALYYDACPGDNCSRKVTPDMNGQWRCEKCNKAYPSPNVRYVLNFTAADATSSQFLTMFNNEAEHLLGRKASEIKLLKERQDENAVKEILNTLVSKTYHFRIRAKAEQFQDEMRVKHSVTNVYPLEYPEANQTMLKRIEAITQH